LGVILFGGQLKQTGATEASCDLRPFARAKKDGIVDVG
jgi:hypothetical protein